MGFGFGVLRLSPKDFWTMTPREMASAMGGGRAMRGAPPTRQALYGLMAAFPDGEERTGHG